MPPRPATSGSANRRRSRSSPRSNSRRAGVGSRLAQRAALPEQVPALVERDLDVLQAPSLGLARLSVGFPLPQLVLLGDELLDRPVDLTIVHVRPPASTQMSLGTGCR